MHSAFFPCGCLGASSGEHVGEGFLPACFPAGPSSGEHVGVFLFFGAACCLASAAAASWAAGLASSSRNLGSSSHWKASAASLACAPFLTAGRVARTPPPAWHRLPRRVGQEAVTDVGWAPSEDRRAREAKRSTATSSSRRRATSTTWKSCRPSQTSSLSGIADELEPVPSPQRNGPSSAEPLVSSGSSSTTTWGIIPIIIIIIIIIVIML